jgi:hypothetical protein
MIPDRQVRSGLIAAALLPFVWFWNLFWNVAAIRTVYRATDWTDFAMFYDAGVAWRTGHALYHSGRFGANLNPPLALLLFGPLASFPEPVALTIWLAISVVAVLTSAVIIVRELRIRVSMVGLLWTLVCFGALHATFHMIAQGNLGWLLMLPATLAWRAARRNQWGGAGSWLAACLILKPQFGWFVFALAYRRHWRAVGALIGVGAVTLTAGLWVFGLSAYQEWLSLGSRVTWYGEQSDASILGFLTRASLPTSSGAPLVPAMASLVTPLWICAVVLVVGLSARSLIRSREDVDRDWAMLWLGSILVSPLGWTYYQWLAVAPLVALYRTHRSTVFWIAFAGSLTVPLIVLRTILGCGPIMTVTVLSAFGWSMLLLWAEVIQIDRHGLQKGRWWPDRVA